MILQVGPLTRRAIIFGRALLDYFLSLLASLVLAFDPFVRLAETLLEGGVRFPSENLLDKGIVAVASSHSAWSTQIIFSPELHAGYLFHLRHEFIDGYQLTGSKIDRGGGQVIAVGDRVDAL